MIPQIQPWIDDEELQQLKRVVSSTFVTEASLTKEFEDITKDLTGSKHAIAITNGTAALFCALKALDIGPGDEVIVPDMTFIASANSVILSGATPVFCDIRPDTLCLDINFAEKILTKKTKAIMPVHLYGQSADMDRIIKFARMNKLKIIEDAAQGVGVMYNQQHVGTFGDLGILSYYGNKTITCGEGGIILTDNDDLAKKCYRLKNHGRDVKGTFLHDHIGYNFAFTEMQAAIGIAQMNKLEKIVNKKNEINEIYHCELSNVGDLTPILIDTNCKPVSWFTSFLTEKSEDLATHLLSESIQTRKFFYPLHLQPCYQDTRLVKSNICSVSKESFEKGISLPSSYDLELKDQRKVIKEIKTFFS